MAVLCDTRWSEPGFQSFVQFPSTSSFDSPRKNYVRDWIQEKEKEKVNIYFFESWSLCCLQLFWIWFTGEKKKEFLWKCNSIIIIFYCQFLPSSLLFKSIEFVPLFSFWHLRRKGVNHVYYSQVRKLSPFSIIPSETQPANDHNYPLYSIALQMMSVNVNSIPRKWHLLLHENCITKLLNSGFKLRKVTRLTR